jgi:hypothetical protein
MERHLPLVDEALPVHNLESLRVAIDRFLASAD